MITVVAHLKAKPGKEEDLKKELLALIEPSRNDQGCVNYDLHQSTNDPAHFIFHENWNTMSDLELHLQQPHLQDFVAKADDLLSEPLQVITANMISQKKE